MLFPIPSRLYYSGDQSWISTKTFNFPIFGFSLEKLLCWLTVLCLLFFWIFELSLVEWVPFDNGDDMGLLHFDYFINIDIVNSWVYFAFHEFAPIVLFDESFPFLFGHCYFLWKPLLPEEPQCHVIPIGYYIVQFPILHYC